MIEKYVLGSFQTNTYVLSENNECVIIDPSLGFEKVYDEIKNKYKIKGVLLTHGHIDHIDGVKLLLDYPIYISQIEYEYLNNPGYTLYGWYQMNLPFDINKVNFIKVKDNDVIKLLNDDIKVILTPGHTLGGVCYCYKDKIFTGDTLFKNSIGRTDFPGGNMNDIFKSIINIIDNYDSNIKLYPGHDDKTTIRNEKNDNMYYKEAKKRI